MNPRIELQVPRVVAQQAVADRMEGAGPREPLRNRVADAAERLVERLLHDVVRAAAHLGGRAAREGQHEDARRIDAVDRQVRDAMGERVRLARARTGDDEQRAGLEAFASAKRLAVGDSLALRSVELFQM